MSRIKNKAFRSVTVKGLCVMSVAQGFKKITALRNTALKNVSGNPEEDIKHLNRENIENLWTIRCFCTLVFPTTIAIFSKLQKQ